MPKARLVFDGDNIYTEKDARIYKLKNDISTKIDGIPWVINDLDSTSTTDALSANMGRTLQDQINSLSWTGKFLSAWDATTGLPTTEPQEDPYTYKVGDYYVVSKVGTTNYKPHWWTYTQWVPSTAVETDTVWVNDKYYFDWADWTRIPDTAIQIWIDTALSTTSTNAVENRAIATAINTKQNTISDLATIRSGASAWATAIQPNDNISQLTNNIWYQTAWDVASAISAVTQQIPVNTSDLNNDSWFITKNVNDLTYYTKTADLAAVSTTWDYDDLLNKPVIPAAQIQSDWNQADNTKLDYIKNKPLIPAAQIQSDWTQNNQSAVDYIKNKPTIDSALSTTSTNAIQNWAVATAVNSINGDITTIQWDITTIGGSITTMQWDISALQTSMWNVVSDAAFSSSWDWDTTHAPSKNAIYDVLWDVETLLANI